MYKFDRHRFRQPRNVRARAKSQSDQSSNFFSTLVAIAALVVSVVSAAASAWQTLLVHEQLTASDRNRSFQDLVQQAGNICELFFPNKIKTYSYAAQADGTSILVVAREDIDPSIYSAELAEKIAAESRKLRLAFTVAGLWSTRDQSTNFSRAEFSVMELFQYFSSPDLSVSYYRDFFAMRYINASNACTNDRGVTLSASIAGLVNDKGTWWIQPDSKPDQVVVAPQANLERMDREQIRQLANQQTELLKNYDSYNQI
ncbi:hypothetical protein NKH99_27825 [Mesorhizobium sp. M0854]|uniref:hypothetical protein n=1 Tax=Mesorhizobium sp. M0854 TaxID=2957013 RepID=UPI003338072E